MAAGNGVINFDLTPITFNLSRCSQFFHYLQHALRRNSTPSRFCLVSAGAGETGMSLGGTARRGQRDLTRLLSWT